MFIIIQNKNKKRGMRPSCQKGKTTACLWVWLLKLNKYNKQTYHKIFRLYFPFQWTSYFARINGTRSMSNLCKCQTTRRPCVCLVLTHLLDTQMHVQRKTWSGRKASSNDICVLQADRVQFNSFTMKMIANIETYSHSMDIRIHTHL